MNIKEANFEDVIKIYYHGTDAHLAAERLTSLIEQKKHLPLATLLRDYRRKAIVSPTEIKLRSAIDRLMNCCSILEITSLTGFVLEIQETNFGLFLRSILDNNHVRRYYEEFYPTKLPQLLRFRLAGANRVIEKSDGTSRNGSISAFLDLDRRFMENLEDGLLLRMLDSFTIRGYRFDDLVQIIGKPEEFIQRLLVAPEQRDIPSRALYEFSLFMQFCFDLRDLLVRANSQPLLQSAMWNHYGYWFDIIGEELNVQLGRALLEFQKWEPRAEDKDAARAVQTYVSEATIVLRTLTSRKFAEPVDMLLRKISE
jgi:hypothetical protein